MIKLNAHIGFQFTELPFLERFRAAAKSGFRAVEFPSPYEYEATQIAELLDEYQLEMVQFSAPAGSTRGTTGICASKQEFLAELTHAVQYAKTLDCRMLHLMSGVSLADLGVTADSSLYRRNLRYAADFLADEGIEPLIEVISSNEVPGYLMSRFEFAEQMLETIPNLGLILDTYHTELLGEDCLRKLNQWWPRVSHIQVADFPGRNEPGTGNIDFRKLLSLLEDHAYQGWVGCEYRPRNSTVDGLDDLWKVMKPSPPEDDRW
ncbi:hydroxypyruvate isomerase family protein [Pseudomonas germanica]|jgi:Hydroxypyruvate isomerase|uniref:TIM barrel protein n=1 Tax=Pseudomonas germanica TaxID=2815720 RepID=A0ABX8YKQ4_9PSED|nr:TIM barrel protein [Pseudomonas germanica]QYY80531.1 TIM barrel protein [Pseudomonas germanica]